ncbi:hypothetical protein WJX72_011666 [[Myrmecia] bisecta]|uniref:adenylyl-sulfate kinase n=1 Tax=[Myrmecia] bisecta TaxID=41462 RepID=A0AAW1P3U0_9CHLO
MPMPPCPNITWHEGAVPREHKEALLGQRACVLWFTGLSGSGKSTVACTLEHALLARGRLTALLDGDNIRHGLNHNLGFSAVDRDENIRRVQEVSKLMVDSGIITLASFISPYRAERKRVRARLQPGDFVEVYMKVPLAVCEQRDPKGLYKLARAGKLAGFTGVDDPYEEPLNPEITLHAADESGGLVSPQAMALQVLQQRRTISANLLSRRSVLCGCAACAVLQPGSLYQRFFASQMAFQMQRYEGAVAPVKQLLFDQLFQAGHSVATLLEIGIGAGPNLRYYANRQGPDNDSLQVVGLDPNPAMAPFATQAAVEAGLPLDQVQLQEGLAEAMPFPANSFDACVCTLVLCSVQDVEATLQEVQRVLKPGGQFLFIEHVLASPDARLLRVAQTALTPLQQLLADGCHLDRDTWLRIRDAKLSPVEPMRFQIEGMGLIGPHIAGIGRLE